MPETVRPERVEAARRFGLANIDAAAVAAREAGLPFWAACALLEKESGGRNVFGHDSGGALAGFPGEVSRGAWEVFRWLVIEKGQTSNGVGPCQITYAGARNADGTRDGGHFRVMEERGLRPWVPHDNMVYGFDLLAREWDTAGTWAKAGEAYNGAAEYGRDLVAKINAWRRRFGIDGAVR